MTRHQRHLLPIHTVTVSKHTTAFLQIHYLATLISRENSLAYKGLKPTQCLDPCNWLFNNFIYAQLKFISLDACLETLYYQFPRKNKSKPYFLNQFEFAACPSRRLSQAGLLKWSYIKSKIPVLITMVHSEEVMSWILISFSLVLILTCVTACCHLKMLLTEYIALKRH